jgi:hypothetical protein
MGPDTIKEIASHPEEPTILAYDESGNRRMPTPVAIRDEIDWKRQGTRGSYRARVLDIRRDNRGRTRLVIQLLSHDGRPLPSGRSRSITSGVMRVYLKGSSL